MSERPLTTPPDPRSRYEAMMLALFLVAVVIAAMSLAALVVLVLL